MEIVEKTYEALRELFPASDTPVAEAAVETAEEEAADTVQEEEAEALPREPGVLRTEHSERGNHLDVLCSAEQIVDVTGVLDREGFFNESISGVDWIKDEQMEVIYDFNRLDNQRCRVVVRVFVPREKPEVPTISAIFPGANWHERETFDFYGVIFTGHPNLERILLPEDADFHPLLKDYMP